MLLPFNEGVGDHRTFIVDITLELILGDVFPRVIPASSRLLNCKSDKIKNSYIVVLNQLSNRHLIFQKLLLTDRASKHISHAALQLRMNKITKEMEQFMKSAERDSHKLKRNNMELSPITRVWLCQRWLLQRVEKYKAGRIRDPRNLFRECALRGIKDPSQITPDEIVAEFYVCKHNLALLEKHGPLLRLRFLKQLVTTAKRHGDTLRASSITGIIQKEAIRKRWHWINRSTQQLWGSLTVRVKIPTTDGGVEEFKTKEGVFNAVSATLVE